MTEACPHRLNDPISKLALTQYENCIRTTIIALFLMIRKRHHISLFSAALALPPLGKIPSLVKEESRVRSRRDQTFDEVNKLEYLNICV